MMPKQLFVSAATGKITEREFTPGPPEPVTTAQVEAALQAHVDATARAHGYRSGDACASYAASTNAAWQAEALAFVAWRDQVWAAAFAIDPASVETLDDVIAAMPPMQWPE
jgi:hypothetical protein